MEHVPEEHRTLVLAAVNAVAIQLSKNATTQERLKAGQVRDGRGGRGGAKEGVGGGKKSKEKEGRGVSGVQ